VHCDGFRQPAETPAFVLYLLQSARWRIALVRVWNKKVFKWRLKVVVDVDDRMCFSSVGRQFHARGAVTENARSSIRRSVSGRKRSPYCLQKGKGKAYLYSAFRETSTQGAQVWITQGCLCKLHHTCRYLANIRHMAPPEWLATHLSTQRTEAHSDERVGMLATDVSRPVM